MSGAFAIYPSLRDRVVFITGGASGIGAEHVTQFAAQSGKALGLHRGIELDAVDVGRGENQDADHT